MMGPRDAAAAFTPRQCKVVSLLYPFGYPLLWLQLQLHGPAISLVLSTTSICRHQHLCWSPWLVVQLLRCCLLGMLVWLLLLQAVIGAGAAGLVAARELRREGHEVVVFEQHQQLGGTWLYTDEVSRWLAATLLVLGPCHLMSWLGLNSAHMLPNSLTSSRSCCHHHCHTAPLLPTSLCGPQVESDPLGGDPARTRVHSSMYRGLATNLPREIMGYSDFPFSPSNMCGRSVDSRRFPCSDEVGAVGCWCRGSGHGGACGAAALG